jgi:hypothetical protein
LINRSELAELNTNEEEQVISEGGPSISMDPITVDETTSSQAESGGESVKEKAKEKANGIKDKLTGKKKFSEKDKRVALFGGVGTLNILAMVGVGVWGYKRYNAGESGWRTAGIALGAWAGVSAIEWLGVRYDFLKFRFDSFSAMSVWREKKDKSA